MQFIPKNIQWFIRFSACLLALCHSLHGGQAPASLPKVLLIGDSISMAYHKTVVRELEGLAEVSRIPGNGEYTGTGVKKIDEWLGETRWDVIHFNWGLWDMYGWQYAGEDRSPATYAKRLDQLVTRMKQTGARLVWATTTPVCPAAESTMRKRWNTEVVISPDQEKQYRDAALRVMKTHHVAVNDLHSLILPDLASVTLAPDDVHFNGTGSETLGRQVARVIRTELDARPAPAAPAVEQPQVDFRKLGFGMFLHYNMATYHGKQWVEGYPCPSTFNPGSPIDTDAWADAAKAAGMTYGVLTAKHVAGFCLWDSELTEYDISPKPTPTPAKPVGNWNNNGSGMREQNPSSPPVRSRAKSIPPIPATPTSSSTSVPTNKAASSTPAARSWPKFPYHARTSPDPWLEHPFPTNHHPRIHDTRRSHSPAPHRPAPRR